MKIEYYVNQLSPEELYEVVKAHFVIYDQISLDDFKKCLFYSPGCVCFDARDLGYAVQIWFNDFSLDLIGDNVEKQRILTSCARLKSDYEKELISKFKNNEEYIKLFLFHLDEKEQSCAVLYKVECCQAEDKYKKEKNKIDKLRRFIERETNMKSEKNEL